MTITSSSIDLIFQAKTPDWNLRTVPSHFDLLHSAERIELGPRCRERYFCDNEFSGLDRLGLPAVGLSQLAGHYHVERALRMHLVEITLGGRGRVSAGLRAIDTDLRTGQMLLVPAGTPYRLTTLEGRAWSTAWALLEPRKWRDFPATAVVLDASGLTELQALLRWMDDERHRDDLIATRLRATLAETLALLLQRSLAHATTGEAPARLALQALFDEVSRAPAADWRSPQLAARLGCSRSQLHRRCIATFGRSPAAQVTYVRMQQAEYWLRTTRLPLKAVAEHVGFRNPFHFSVAFKRLRGLAPAHFRAMRG